MEAYAERNEYGTLRVRGTRVSLGSVVQCFWNGDTPETIVSAFPTLTLEKVYGAIAHYLANREAIDHELDDLGQQCEETRSAAKKRNRELRERLLNSRGTSAA